MAIAKTRTAVGILRPAGDVGGCYVPYVGITKVTRVSLIVRLQRQA